MLPYKRRSFNTFKDKLTFVSYFHVLHFSTRKSDMDRMKHGFIFPPYLFLRHTHPHTHTHTRTHTPIHTNPPTHTYPHRHTHTHNHPHTPTPTHTHKALFGVPQYVDVRHMADHIIQVFRTKRAKLYRYSAYGCHITQVFCI
jgi:hypothetical protein